MERPESEIVALGDYTKGLLNDETFNALFKEYTDQSLSAIVSSKPHELKLREFEYAKLQAMTGFADFLAGFATSAQKIIDRDAAPEAADDDYED